MPIDLTKLTDQELDALEAGDLTQLSEATLTQLEKAAAEEERAKLSANISQQAAAAGYPIAYPAGISQAPTRQQSEEALTAAVRYGVPIAAGVATGGVGLVPALVTGAAGGIGETVAELMEMGRGEREELSGRSIAASTLASAAPVFQAAGAPIASGLKTFGAQIAAGEGSRFIEKGKFELPQGGLKEQAIDYALRLGLPAAVGVASKYGSEFEQAKINLAEVAAEGRRPLVMDANPRLAPLEAAVFQRQGSVARQYADEMEMSLGEIVNKAYGTLSPQSQAAIAEELAPYVGKYDELRAAATSAREAADEAEAAVKTAAATRSKDLAKLRADAEVAQNRLTIEQNNFDAMKNNIFGRRTPVMTDEASIGALEQRMKAAAKSAQAGVSASFDALYANAGLRPNDVVISKDSVLRSISARSAPGRPMEGDIASEDARKAIALFFGEDETATLEKLRKYKQVIADKLPAGSPSDLAGRYASSLYDALKKSSARYIRENYSEDVANAFAKAQRLAAGDVATEGTGAVQFLIQGKFPEFYAAIKEKGKAGQVAKEIDAYATSLNRVTGAAIRSGQVGTAEGIGAINAARQFKKDVNSIILNGIIEESIVGRSGGINRVVDVIDQNKLMKTLGFFESQGYDLNQLGVRRGDVQKLIKATAMVGDEPLTVAKLNEFLALLPSTGGDVAAARVAHRQAVANAMITAGAKERTAAFRKAADIAKRAGISAADAEQAFNAAAAEPLTQFFAEQGSMMIAKGSLQNSNWIDTIITKEPEIISGLIDSIRAQGAIDPKKLVVLDKMREAAITYAVKRFLPDLSLKNQRIDAEAILAPFINESREAQMFRQNLRSMMGGPAYEQLKTVVINPIRKALVNKAALGQPIYNYAADLKAAISAEAIATGKATRGTLLAGAIVNTATAAQEKYYNLIAQIWLNPKYGTDLAKAGYNINRFAQLSAANAMAVDLAMREDQREQQEGLQQQYLTPR